MRETDVSIQLLNIDAYLFCRFVSCIAFVHDQGCPQGLLISGSGDSTVSY